jgi:hypothetical protein
VQDIVNMAAVAVVDAQDRSRTGQERTVAPQASALALSVP